MRASDLALAVALALSAARVAPASAQPAGVTGGEQVAWSILDDVVRVTASAPDGSRADEGFGFVFGERDGRLYIATADHVVRGADPRTARPDTKVQVVFHDDQGHHYDAELLDLQLAPSLGDLAVLDIAAPASFQSQWPAMADADNLIQGDRAWRIGKLKRWVPATNPGEFVGRDPIWLQFDDLDTPRGSSGGPVVTADGIIGIVVAEGGQSGVPSQVLPIGTIAEILRGWQLPWNLRKPSGTPSPTADQTRPASSPPPPTAPQQTARTAAAAPFVAPGPAPAAPPGTADRVRDFTLRYYAAEAGFGALDYLREALTDPVEFYGRRTSVDQVLQQQAAAMMRWPDRSFVVRPDTLTVDCEAAGTACQVSGIVDFDERSIPRNDQSRGAERFTLQLVLDWQHIQVAGINSVVLSRQHGPIQAAGADATAGTPGTIPPAQDSRWTTQSAAECATRSYTWHIDGDMFEFLDQSRELDMEQVVDRGPDEVVTRTVQSNHRGGGTPVGTKWSYSLQADGRVRVQNMQTGQTFVLTRCDSQ